MRHGRGSEYRFVCGKCRLAWVAEGARIKDRDVELEDLTPEAKSMVSEIADLEPEENSSSP